MLEAATSAAQKIESFFMDSLLERTFEPALIRESTEAISERLRFLGATREKPA
jgi:hypothetical protein